MPLNSSDVLFRELRDVNFGSIGPKLRNKTMHMREEYVTHTHTHVFYSRPPTLPFSLSDVRRPGKTQEKCLNDG